MTLQLPNNVMFDIYRGFNVAAPYPAPGKLPDIQGAVGSLNQHVNCGRFGFQAKNVYWTYELLTASNVDIRDAYDSELDPARNNALADTIVIQDFPIVGWCTAFYVVDVIKDRSEGFNRVYLDRLQPRQGPCMPAGAQKACCDGFIIPDALNVKLSSSCPCLHGQILPLTYISPNWYYGPTIAPSCGAAICYLYAVLGCGGGSDCTNISLTVEINNLASLGGDGVIGAGFVQAPCTCKQPINWTTSSFQLTPVAGSSGLNCNDCNHATITATITS